MGRPHGDVWSRRAFARGIAAAATAWLGGFTPRRAGAEPPPETTRIAFQDTPAACLAPQYLAEELLRGEGFNNEQFVRLADYGPALSTALVSGQIHFGMNDAPNHVLHVDRGLPIVVLAGVHAGCYELLGTDRVHTIRDLSSRRS